MNGHSGVAAAEEAAAAPFPWAALTAFGLGVLRWPPETFWAATPAELVAAAAAMAPAADGVPPRATLTELMARFPDAAGPGDGGPGGGGRKDGGRGGGG